MHYTFNNIDKVCDVVEDKGWGIKPLIKDTINKEWPPNRGHKQFLDATVMMSPHSYILHRHRFFLVCLGTD